MNIDQRPPGWAVEAAQNIELCGYDHDWDVPHMRPTCCDETRLDIAVALAAAYQRGKDEAPRVMIPDAKEVVDIVLPALQRALDLADLVSMGAEDISEKEGMRVEQDLHRAIAALKERT